MESRLHGKLDLPGFRFHSTEEELVGFYLRKKVQSQPFSFDVIETLDLYRYDPWQLPDLAVVGEREWFFFDLVDKKCAQSRRSVLTSSGNWKATGTDKADRNHKFQCIGLKKTLVFCIRKAPNGEKTDWSMNEYRMPDFLSARRIYVVPHTQKGHFQKTLDRRGIAGEGTDFKKNSAASSFQNDLNLMNHEIVSMSGGLPYSNEEVMECTSPFKDNKLKHPELQVPMLFVDKLFIPWIET